MKLQGKLWKKDSLLAKQLFAGVEEKCAALRNAPQHLNKYSQVYSGHLDSLTTALSFLKTDKLQRPELDGALSQFSSLQDKLNQTEVVKKFLSERKRQLKENLEKLGMLKELKGFQKQAYYYAAQVREYRALWEDPAKLEKKLLEVLSKREAFQDFFRKNSQLASLFALPGGNASAVSLAGLQTRASVQQNIQDRFGSGPQVQQLIQQNCKSSA
jgi:predicted RNase H-like nuclease (RuvC/YqgF family)